MRGRRPLATWEEQARVRALAGEGLSLRAIAVAVFGDEAKKDRVPRILRRRASGLELAQAELAALAHRRGLPIGDLAALEDDDPRDLDELVAELEDRFPAELFDGAAS